MSFLVSWNMKYNITEKNQVINCQNTNREREKMEFAFFELFFVNYFLCFIYFISAPPGPHPNYGSLPAFIVGNVIIILLLICTKLHNFFFESNTQISLIAGRKSMPIAKLRSLN